MTKRIYVTETRELDAMIAELRGQKAVGLDIETTGLDPMTGLLRLAQFSKGTAKRAETTWIVDCFKVPIKALQPLFTDKSPTTWMGHNLKFEISWLIQNGITMPSGVLENVGYSRYFCTMLCHQILWAGRDESRLKFSGLASVAQRYAGINVDKTQQQSDWAQPELSQDQLDYAALDAEIMWDLVPEMSREIREADLVPTLNLEMRALPAIAFMQLCGLKIDVERWKELAAEALEESKQLEKTMAELVGRVDMFGDSAVNWASPQQVVAILQERNLSRNITATDEGTLATLVGVDPLAALLLKHRELAKLRSTYGLEFLAFVNARTGRIHPDFLQLGAAASGRMSCSKPNMQQIPRDKRYRRCFIPDEGHVFVVCDYSQIELRIAAERANEERMIQAYKDGEDLHTVSAMLMLGESSADARQRAKSANFALLYGAGAERYQAYAEQAFGLHLPLEEASRIRKLWLKSYPDIQAWHKSTPQYRIETRTLGGRRRLDVEKYTEKLNTPVQGTGADGLKGALALMYERKDTVPSFRIVNAVHDECVLETAEEHAPQIKEFVEQCMIESMQEYLKVVPVEAEGKIVKNWGEK